MSTIGERLKAARLDKGISQRAMAEAAGISQSAYSDLERGESAARSLESFARMARFLQVNADYLLGNEEGETLQATLAGLAPLEREFIDLLRSMRAGRRHMLLRMAHDLQEEEQRERRFQELVAAIEEVDAGGLLDRTLSRLFTLYRQSGDMRAAVSTVAAELLEVGPEGGPDTQNPLQET